MVAWLPCLHLRPCLPASSAPTMSALKQTLMPVARLVASVAVVRLAGAPIWPALLR